LVNLFSERILIYLKPYQNFSRWEAFHGFWIDTQEYSIQPLDEFELVENYWKSK